MKIFELHFLLFCVEKRCIFAAVLEKPINNLKLTQFYYGIKRPSPPGN